MNENASIQVPEWAADVWDVYIPPQWPWAHRIIQENDWDRWATNTECQGLWKTLDPFPKRIANAWDELMITHAPRIYRNGDNALHAELLRQWMKRFTSAMIRLQVNTIPNADSSMESVGDRPSHGHFVGMGQVATIQHWQPATCGHQAHPQIGCDASARAVIPVMPRLNMNYWWARIQDGDYHFDAVLEAPMRVDLGSRGPVCVCRSQQLLEWFLPRAARKLDRHWHRLPHLIANSQIEDLFFRASRSQR